MRVADNMNYGQVKENLRKNRSEMAELQNQAATMKRVTRPSDDPVAATRVLGARTAASGIDQYKKDLNNARSFLEATDHALGEMTDMLMRLKELALAQANAPSSSPDVMRVVAEEVAQMYSQTVSIGNRMLGDRYLFGGYRTTEKPFASSGEYLGDKGEITIEINKDVYLPMNIPGPKVFLGDKLGTKTLIKDEKETVPKTVDHLKNIQLSALEGQINKDFNVEIDHTDDNTSITLRGIAGVGPVHVDEKEGENVFDVIRSFGIGLKTNDKGTIQDSIERIDRALQHTIQARSQVGSRTMTLDNVMNTLQKAKVDHKVQESEAEDADAFELFSDITKKEATLQATLQTSGKLLQPSLLDFLR